VAVPTREMKPVLMKAVRAFTFNFGKKDLVPEDLDKHAAHSPQVDVHPKRNSIKIIGAGGRQINSSPGVENGFSAFNLVLNKNNQDGKEEEQIIKKNIHGDTGNNKEECKPSVTLNRCELEVNNETAKVLHSSQNGTQMQHQKQITPEIKLVEIEVRLPGDAEERKNVNSARMEIQRGGSKSLWEVSKVDLNQVSGLTSMNEALGPIRDALANVTAKGTSDISVACASKDGQDTSNKPSPPF